METIRFNSVTKVSTKYTNICSEFRKIFTEKSEQYK